MGLYDGRAGAGELRLDRAGRRAARRAGRAGGGRGGAGPFGRRAGARLPQLRPGAPARRGDPQPGRLRPARGACCARRWRRSACPCSACCAAHDAVAAPSRHLGLVPAAERRVRGGGRGRRRWPSWSRRASTSTRCWRVARSAPPSRPSPVVAAEVERPGRRPSGGRGGRRAGVHLRLRGDRRTAARRRAPRSRRSTRCTTRPCRRAPARWSSAAASPRCTRRELSANAPLRAAVAALAASGAPIAAECAGLLWLCRSLDGAPMCGVLDADAAMTGTLTLGYRDAVAMSPTAGSRRRAPGCTGHEFHRTAVIERAGQAPRRRGRGGTRRPRASSSGGVHASYLHLHWAGTRSSLPGWSARPPRWTPPSERILPAVRALRACRAPRVCRAPLCRSGRHLQCYSTEDVTQRRGGSARQRRGGWRGDRARRGEGGPGECAGVGLVVGVGACQGAAAGEIGALIDAALAGLPVVAVRHVATVDVKASEPGIVEAAAARGWQVIGYPAADLAAVEVPNPSALGRARIGTPSVAEAAALRGGGELVVPKRKSAMATVAVATIPARTPMSLVTGAHTTMDSTMTTPTDTLTSRPVNTAEDAPIDLGHHGDAELTPGLVDLAVNVRAGAPPAWLRTGWSPSLTEPRRVPEARGRPCRRGRPARPPARRGAPHRRRRRGVHADRAGAPAPPRRDRAPAVHRARGGAAGRRSPGRAADPRRRLPARPRPGARATPTWSSSATRPTRPPCCIPPRRSPRWPGPGGSCVVDEAFIDAVPGET